jgi:hypothetical protein
MTRLRTLLAVAVVLALAATPAAAQVVIELHDQPLLPHDRAARNAPEPESGGGLAAPRLGTRNNTPSTQFWFIPRFNVDTTAFGDTTLWAVRNEGGADVDVAVEYFNSVFSSQRVDMFTLVPNQVKTVNIRDVPGLAVDPDGFARGFVRMMPTGPVSVDSLQVDTTDNFAQGSVSWTINDFCADWMGRFASFGPGQGSVFTFLVNGPRGSDPTDMPTIVGDVYNESGTFINSFTIRTSQWVFSIEILDLVLGGVTFGSVELSIDSTFSPAGILSVSHSAEGRFSVGLRGICRDLPPMMP